MQAHGPWERHAGMIADAVTAPRHVESWHAETRKPVQQAKKQQGELTHVAQTVHRQLHSPYERLEVVQASRQGFACH